MPRTVSPIRSQQLCCPRLDRGPSHSAMPTAASCLGGCWSGRDSPAPPPAMAADDPGCCKLTTAVTFSAAGPGAEAATGSGACGRPRTNEAAAPAAECTHLEKLASLLLPVPAATAAAAALGEACLLLAPTATPGPLLCTCAAPASAPGWLGLLLEVAGSQACGGVKGASALGTRKYCCSRRMTASASLKVLVHPKETRTAPVGLQHTHSSSARNDGSREICQMEAGGHSREQPNYAALPSTQHFQPCSSSFGNVLILCTLWSHELPTSTCRYAAICQ